MSLKMQCFMLLLAVVFFNTSECRKSNGTRRFHQEDNWKRFDQDSDLDYDDEHVNHSGFNVSSPWPFSLAGRRFLNNSDILEAFKARLYAHAEKELQREHASPIPSTTDIPTSTSTHLAETTPETSTELQTEPTTELSTELAIESTTESRPVDVFRSTQATEYDSTKPTTTTEPSSSSSSSLKDVWFSENKHPPETDLTLFMDRYEEHLHKSDLLGFGPMPEPFSFTEQSTEAARYRHLKQIRPKVKPTDQDFRQFVVGNIFDEPIVLKIEVRYNGTNKLYLPYNAVFHSEVTYHGKKVRITWAHPNNQTYTIVFGRAESHNLCYFALKTELNKEPASSIRVAERYQLTQPLMNIEGEIKLDYGVTVKISSLHNGNLQQIYRELIGCPVLRGTPISLFMICFFAPVTFLAFVIVRSYSLDSYPECRL